MFINSFIACWRPVTHIIVTFVDNCMAFCRKMVGNSVGKIRNKWTLYFYLWCQKLLREELSGWGEKEEILGEAVNVGL
jgi:hypothetical protein